MPQDDRQKAARRIFMDVADLPASDRTAAIERTCGADADLRAEVEALLSVNGQAGGWHGDGTPLTGRTRRAVSVAPRPHPGEGGAMYSKWPLSGTSQKSPEPKPHRSKRST